MTLEVFSNLSDFMLFHLSCLIHYMIFKAYITTLWAQRGQV